MLIEMVPCSQCCPLVADPTHPHPQVTSFVLLCVTSFVLCPRLPLATEHQRRLVLNEILLSPGCVLTQTSPFNLSHLFMAKTDTGSLQPLRGFSRRQELTLASRYHERGCDL